MELNIIFLKENKARRVAGAGGGADLASFIDSVTSTWTFRVKWGAFGGF